MFAFIKTLPPVEGRVPDHDIRFPFTSGSRSAAGNFSISTATIHAGSKPAPDWNRGAYLVNGPGHCAEVTVRATSSAASSRRSGFAGGPNPEGEGTIPNITQHGLKDY